MIQGIQKEMWGDVKLMTEGTEEDQVEDRNLI